MLYFKTEETNAVFAILITLLLIPNICLAEDVRDNMPPKGKYEYIKKQSVLQNIELFNTYEEKKSKKVIFICIPNSVMFKVGAVWGLDFIDRKSANRIAKQACLDSSSTERYVVLGYKSKNEIKY